MIPNLYPKIQILMGWRPSAKGCVMEVADIVAETPLRHDVGQHDSRGTLGLCKDQYGGLALFSSNIDRHFGLDSESVAFMPQGITTKAVAFALRQIADELEKLE